MIDIVPLEKGHRTALERFFADVPEGDRTFFQEDVADARTIDSWFDDPRSRRLVAVETAQIHGYLAIVPSVGWESHVGELRVVVDRARRRRGVGRQLARRGLLEALDMGLRKVVVEAAADQHATVELFNDIGFEAEALLKDHVRTSDGEFRDLLILAHQVEEVRESMAVMGIVEELR